MPIDDPTRPRVLVVGLSADVVAALQRRFPNTEHFDDLKLVAVTDFDVLVTDQFDTAWRVCDFINVLRVGWRGVSPDDLVQIDDVNITRSWALSVPGTHSTRYDVLANDDMATLMEDAIVQARQVARSDENGVPVLSRLIRPQELCLDFDPLNSDGLTPFLISSDGTVVAGALTTAGGHQVWFVPLDVDVVGWVTAAVREWSSDDPISFPLSEVSAGDWWRTEAWQLPVEKDVRDRMDQLNSEFASLAAQHQINLATLQSELEDKARTADGGRRRLLTAQGEPLVRAVIDGFESLGFDIENSDDLVPEGSDRLQDLCVQDASAPDVVIIAEVRGYEKGGKARDLNGKIRRFRERYIRAFGSPPSATWYVANHHLHADPRHRPKLLQGADEDVATFGDFADGLIIDTVQLFEVLGLIDRGQLDREVVRSSLKSSRGRWAPPSQ